MLFTLISLKLGQIISADMINFQMATRIGPQLLNASRSLIFNSTTQRDSGQDQLVDVDVDADTDANADTKAVPKTSDQPNPPSTEYLVLNWLEAIFAWFQVVILWHDPILSVMTLSAIVPSYLLLTYQAPRFYASIMIGIFVYNLVRFWFRHVWPEVRVPPENEDIQRLDVDRWTYLHPQLMTLSEMRNFLHNLMQSFQIYITKSLELRQKRPIAFCLAICSVLSCTAYIGNRVTGAQLIFTALAILMSAPGIYVHLIPEKYREFIRLRVCKFLEKSQEPIVESPSCELKTQPEKPKKMNLIEILRSKNLKTSELTSETLTTDLSGEPSVPAIDPYNHPFRGYDLLTRLENLVAAVEARFPPSEKEIADQDTESELESEPECEADSEPSLLDRDSLDESNSKDEEEQYDGFVLL